MISWIYVKYGEGYNVSNIYILINLLYWIKKEKSFILKRDLRILPSFVKLHCALRNSNIIGFLKISVENNTFQEIMLTNLEYYKYKISKS